MLGVPFREDPGVPGLYGSYLALTGLPASSLMHGIWAFAVMGILSTYAFVRAFWGEVAGVTAAALWAVLPISHDILGWHGLANAAALALMPILLAYLTSLVGRGVGWREAVGFALVLVAIAAVHRLSLVVSLLAVAGTVGVAFALGMRGRIVPGLLRSGAAAVLLCGGVAYDLVTRGRSFGGSQGYRAYLSSKVDLSTVGSDLTAVFSIVALGATALAVRWAFRERRLLPLLTTLVVVALLAYAWLVQLPLVYFRLAYFLPVALAPTATIEKTAVRSLATVERSTFDER
jgi:hypothetical protein